MIEVLGHLYVKTQIFLGICAFSAEIQYTMIQKQCQRFVFLAYVFSTILIVSVQFVCFW